MGPLLVATVVLSLLVGVSLGVLGGGGSILTVPILVYVAGLDAKEAIAASLLVVGVTSLAGTVGHARQGRVRWRTGLLFGAAGLGGAFLGGLLGGLLPGRVLLVAFAVMMLATAVAMIRERTGPAAPAHAEIPVLTVLLEGLVVGLVTGLVGAGGGFLVVPALALLGGLPMSVAVGTSLLVIGIKSFGGLAGYLSAIDLPWDLVAAVTVAAVLGTLAGSRLVGVLPERLLRQGFGWFVFAMAFVVLGQELPAAIFLPGLGGAVVVLGAGLLCWTRIDGCPVRRFLRPREQAAAPRHRSPSVA